MSGITQLPGPGPGPTTTPVQPSTHPQSNPVVTVPVVQAPSPYWVDPANPPVPMPHPPQIHYYTLAPPATPPGPPPAASQANPANPAQSTVPRAPRQSESAPIPRPRKPYTTTKVREMWSTAEHERMLEGLRLYKRDWAKVTRYVGTRSAAQVRSHAQKYFDRVARDKTDEYVPRARPKRKSATPYPRKAREDTSTQKTHLASQPPAVACMPSQPNAISMPMQMAMQPVQGGVNPLLNAHSVHHQMPIQLTQSPLMGHVHSGSPYVAQQMSMPHTLPQGVFSPYVTVCAPHPGGQGERAVQNSPAPHASPVSYMSGHAYAAHSPAHPQQMGIAQPQVYSVFSPITPGGFATPMRSPVGQGQVSVVSSGHVGMGHVPTHSHPNGPVDNCAKCAALQRYGTVLQEIGEIRNPAMGGSMTQSTERRKGEQRANGNSGAHRQRTVGAGKNGEGRTDASDSSGGQQRESGSSPSTEEARGSSENAADQRARRAKVMKARKVKRNAAISKVDHMYESDRSSESCSSAPRTMLKEQFPSPRKESMGSGTKQRKRSLKRDSGIAEVGERYGGTGGFDEISTKKKGRHGERKDGRPLKRVRKEGPREPSKKTSEEDLSTHLPDRVMINNQASVNSSPATRVLGDRSEESRRKGSGSPAVETYSPIERKEIFDAVKSLQILAKTSSSPSSSESKRDQQGAVVE